MNIDELFDRLDRAEMRIPLELLERWLADVRVSFADVASYVRFHPERYVRNLMRQGSAYQALVLCWRNGQRSPIHDHSGSSCGVLVVQGTAIETVYESAPNGTIYPAASRMLHAGSAFASQDADVHQVSNLQADRADLVTLHVYSPPLLVMNMYSPLDGASARFEDPVNEEFYSGAGI